MNEDFKHIVALIQQSRSRAYQAVNAELVNLYWQVGQYASIKLSQSVWGDKTIEELSKYIQKKNHSQEALVKEESIVCGNFMKHIGNVKYSPR